MTLLPQLQDELVASARQHFAPHPEHRWTAHSRRFTLLAVSVLLTSVTTASAVLLATGVVGGAPSRPVPRVGSEERSGMARTRAPRVLAVAQVPLTGRIELIGYRTRGFGGHGELLCLDLAQATGTTSGACDSSLPPRAAGLVGTGSRGTRRPRLAVGATTEDAQSVDVFYDHAGRHMVAKALLLPVTRELAAGVGTSAFTYYLAEVPADAKRFAAVARDSMGRKLWRAAFPGPR